jgi:hypothetical protein
MNILALLSVNNLKWAGIALLVVALGVQTLRLSSAKKDTQVALSQVASLNAQIEAQNAGIEALKTEAERKSKVSAEAIKKASKAVARAEAKAARIEAARTPVTCEESIDFLVKEAAGGAE